MFFENSVHNRWKKKISNIYPKSSLTVTAYLKAGDLKFLTHLLLLLVSLLLLLRFLLLFLFSLGFCHSIVLFGSASCLCLLFGRPGCSCSLLFFLFLLLLWISLRLRLRGWVCLVFSVSGALVFSVEGGFGFPCVSFCLLSSPL